MYRSSAEQVRGDELWSGHASPQVLPLDYTRIDEFLCFLHSVPRHASHYNVVPLLPLPRIAQQDYARGEQRVAQVTPRSTRRSYRTVIRAQVSGRVIETQVVVSFRSMRPELVRGVVLRSQIGRNPTALAHRDALRPRPVADLAGSAGRIWPTATTPTSAATDRPAGHADKWGKCIAQSARVLRADVQFVRRAVHRKGNGFLSGSLVAVHIANEQDLYALRHSFTSLELMPNGSAH